MNRLFVVDSRRRLDPQNTTPEEYEYRLSDAIKNGDTVDLVAAQLPKTVYPVIQGFNDRLFAVVDDGAQQSATITLESKDYTGASLAQELQDKIIAAFTAFNPGDLIITYDGERNKFRYNNVSVGAFLIIGGRSIQGTDRNITNTGTDANNNSTFEVCNLIGIGPANLDFSSPAIQFSDNQIDISYPRYMHLDISFDSRTGFSDTVTTNETYHSFIVPYGESNFIDVERFTEQHDFRQSVRVTGNVQNISVRWYPPDYAARRGFTFGNSGFSFGGIDHQLIFRVR